LAAQAVLVDQAALVDLVDPGAAVVLAVQAVLADLAVLA
jgi:hypothetical protein